MTATDRALSLGGRRVVDGIVARINSPGGFDAFANQVRATRGCRRPVRLTGRVYGVDGNGRPELQFDSGILPDGVLLKACGTRRESLCPPCASLYRGDAFALVAAGLRGGKEVPESIEEHPAVLLTLTAPSFGAVHRRRPDGTCHPWGSRCSHGRALVCSLRHVDTDEALGQALCSDCYDYEGAVLFNAGVSELWRRTMIYALRALGAQVDLSAREAARKLRLSYVKVVEFQRRGSVHLHALVRVDCRENEHGEPPAGIDANMLVTALRIASRRVSTPVPGSDDGRRMAWGSQLDAAAVSDADNGRRRASAYLAKYATKGSDEHGALDHRLRSAPPAHVRLPDHLRRLVETAWDLGNDESLADVRLQLWAHTCGYRGHFLTKSRRYSTTFAELRNERLRWRVAEKRGQLADESQTGADADVREWTFMGSGFLTAGDACIARNLEAEERLSRWLARDRVGDRDAETDT